MRTIMLATVLTAVLGVSGVSGAFAQSSASYPYCLMMGPAQDCTYTSIAQCVASKRGNADFCEPNNWYSGAPDHSRVRQ